MASAWLLAVSWATLRTPLRPSPTALAARNGWCLTAVEARDMQHLRTQLSRQLDYLPPADGARVLAALELAYQAADPQRPTPARDHRRIALAVALAELLADLQLGADALVVGLLHAAVAAGDLGAEDVAQAEVLLPSGSAMLAAMCKVCSPHSPRPCAGLP